VSKRNKNYIFSICRGQRKPSEAVKLVQATSEGAEYFAFALIPREKQFKSNAVTNSKILQTNIILILSSCANPTIFKKLNVTITFCAKKTFQVKIGTGNNFHSFGKRYLHPAPRIAQSPRHRQSRRLIHSRS
jgi:hypothetical protein